MALQDRFPAYKRVIATAGVENAQIAATTINFWEFCFKFSSSGATSLLLELLRAFGANGSNVVTNSILAKTTH